MALFLSLFGSHTSARPTARAVYGVAIHAAAWLAVNWLAVLVAGDAPARHAYGVLCGWWASLYFGYVCGVRVAAAAPAFLIYCAYGLTAFGLGWHSFYHELPDTLDAAFLGVVVLRALAFASPILVNDLILRARERWSFIGK
jgi:hypothetical protein